MRSKQKNVYFLYNYSINCWGRIDPETQECKQVCFNIKFLQYVFIIQLTELGRSKRSDWRRSLQDTDSALLYFTPIIRSRSWRPSSKLCFLWAKAKWLSRSFKACNKKNKYHYYTWNYQRKVCFDIFTHLKRMKYRISCTTVRPLFFCLMQCSSILYYHKVAIDDYYICHGLSNCSRSLPY